MRSQGRQLLVLTSVIRTSALYRLQTQPTYSIRRCISTAVKMAPPKSALDFLDFVNASPTRKHAAAPVYPWIALK
jgi:hypothetical protein